METMKVNRLVNFDPLFCPPEALRGHIIKTHLNPITRYWNGVADWDYGLAEFRGISLALVVKRICEMITQPDEVMMADLLANESRSLSFQDKFAVFKKLGWEYLDVAAHRQILVKNLHGIDSHNLLGSFDWSPIEIFVPGARDMQVDLTIDTVDKPFDIGDALVQSLKLRYGTFKVVSSDPRLYSQLIPVNMGFETFR
jgi:hypothetical protein